MKAFIRDPASNINALNQIIPALISDFAKEPKPTSKQIETLIEALTSKKIIDKNDVAQVLFANASVVGNETKKFVISRIRVMFDNIIDQVANVDQFDFISKILLDLYAQVFDGVDESKSIERLGSSNQLMGRLLIRAMLDQSHLQLHYRQLTTQFQDLALVSLAGLNDTLSGKHDIKRKTLYAMLNEYAVFQDIKKVKATFIDIGQEQDEDNKEEVQESEIVKQIKLALKKQYEKAYISFLSIISLKQADLVKKVLLEMPKKVIHNFENPLILSDFLTHYLNQEEDIETQVLALRAIFILLEKHGLDYPNYYKKLYQMIKPKIITVDSKVEIQSVFSMSEKGRFLRLLDLSLRSPILPTQLIASFLKRLWRTVASWGVCFTTQDIMFLIGFTQNLLMRHAKCLRLVHRKSNQVLELSSDPYHEDETDPLNTRALSSSLWELDTVLRQHMDSGIRNYAKVFKTEFIRKTAYTKCEEFTQADPLAILKQDLDEVDNEKEGDAFKKHLMIKHGQYSIVEEINIGKRNSETYAQEDYEFNQMMDEANQPNKRARFAEEFEQIDDMFALHP